MRQRVLFVAVTWAAVCGVPAWCQESGSSTSPSPPVFMPLTDEVFRPPADEAAAEKIETMITKLGSPKYQEREEASQGLLDIGLPTFAQLRRAYCQADELEVRLAIEETVRKAYFNHHVFNENGFLGISMYPYPPGRPRTTRNQGPPAPVAQVPKGTVGVEVAKVQVNTGAARSGLKEGDLIIAVDGKPLKGPDLSRSLSNAIRSNRPGTTVTLSVFRGADKLKLKATLGRPPEASLRHRTSGRIIGTEDLFLEATARFPAWWAKHFGESPTRLRP